MARTGRPRKRIDKAKFEDLCRLQCTELEICDEFDVSHVTLNKWCGENYHDDDGNPMTFLQVFEQKRGRGKISLRRMQWHLAETNAAMAIFLGKNMLGQSDNYDVGVKQGAEVQIYLPDNGRDEPIEDEQNDRMETDQGI